MLDKQGRDAPPAPVMPEVAAHRDGGLRRPAQEATRPATVTASMRTALEAALPARVAQMFTPPPPPPPDFPAPVTLRTPPTYFSTVYGVPIERAPSGPRSPSATSQRGLSLFSPVTANPAGIRPDGALPLGTAVTPSPQVPRAIHEVIHVQP